MSNKESINKAGRLTRKQRNHFFKLGILSRLRGNLIDVFMTDSGQRYYEEAKEYFQLGWNQQNLKEKSVSNLLRRRIA